MDRVKKIFAADETKQSGENQQSADSAQTPDPVRDIFEGGLFGNINQLFVNPPELQKQIESQLQEILRQIEEAEGGEFPEDTQFLERSQLMRDEELKGEDFKRLIALDKSSPFISTSPSVRRSDATRPKNKLTDDQKVLDRIHGIIDVPTPPEAGMTSQRHVIAPFVPAGHPRIDIFAPPGSSGRGMFQGVITTVVRRPDGSTETKKITYDKEGNQTTTIQTKDKHGKELTKTIVGAEGNMTTTLQKPSTEGENTGILAAARHLFVNAAGYSLPRNLW